MHDLNLVCMDSTVVMQPMAENSVFYAASMHQRMHCSLLTHTGWSSRSA